MQTLRTKKDKMKPAHLAITAVVYVVVAFVTLAVIRGLNVGDTPLAMIVGAIVGTQVGAILHAREPESISSLSVKILLGSVLAGAAVLVGLLVYFLLGLEHAEVTVPISAIGSFAFPFALFNQFFHLMRKSSVPNS